jgi:hypothetical protein
MGWLRELMAEAAPPVRSYGQLARAAIAHPAWPVDTRPQARSLASLFSKLDRNQELDWLADRPAAQAAIAEVLGTSLARVASALSGALVVTDTEQRQLRLDDVPFARALELDIEPLPPGVPELVLQPPRWDRLLWIAPSGAGRSLVGRWLSARGLAAHVDALTERDALASVAQSGPVFLEFHGVAAAQAFLEAGPRSPVCVAAPFDDATDISAPPGFSVIRSPAPETFVDSLVRWLEPRLSPDGQFDAAGAVDVLYRAARDGNARTLGDLLGWAGLVDELGVRELARRGPQELARRYVARRMRMSQRADSSPVAWRAEAYDLLVGMCRRAYMDSSLPWDAPRTLAEWAQLVPDEYQRTVDPGWLKVALARSASPSTLKEVDRALRDLPPGGYGVVNALKAAGLLRVTARGEALGPAPRWLASWFATDARRELVAGSAFEWGEALLEPTAAGQVYAELAARVERDADAVIEDVLELEASSNPAHVAAVECVARAVGLALLTDTIEPPEGLVALWDAAVSRVVDVHGAPAPRIGGLSSSRPDLGTGAYLLALLRLSETLPSNEGRRHLQLRPWLVPRPASLTPVLDAILLFVSVSGCPPALVDAAYALAARLLPQRREVPGFVPHMLERPALILDAVTRDCLDWETAEATLAAPTGRGLTAVALQAGIPWPEISRAFFAAWTRAGQPDATRVLGGALGCPDLWAHAPQEAMLQLIARAADPAAIPWTTLSDETWLAALSRFSSLADHAAPWSGRGEATVAQRLTRDLPRGAGAGAVWQHWPSAALAALATHLPRTPEPAAAFVEGVPPSAAGPVLEAIASWVRDTTHPAPLRPWLHKLVARRAPAWRSAYALLAEIERAGEHARSPRG